MRIRPRPIPDRYHLYEASVQNAEADLDFAEKAWRELRGGTFRALREDFCGTAALACAFAARGEDHRALGLDLDPATLAWARAHNLPAIGAAAERVRLLRRDVRAAPARGEASEVIFALNFSYWIFRERSELVRYFRAARAGLRRDGLLILDAFGGTEAMIVNEDRRRVEASTCLDGTRVPAFTYLWDQARFDALDHEFVCRIHFEVRGRRIRNAFTYHWRFWTLPELADALREVGFREVAFYSDGWDKRGESDGNYRRRRTLDHGGVWVAYVVGLV